MAGENWFGGARPEPAPDAETLYARLAARFGGGAADALRRAMERGAADRNGAFYAVKNRNPALSAALTLWYDGESLPQFAAFLADCRALLRGGVLDVGCDNGLLTMAVGRMAPDCPILGYDRCAEAVEAARVLCAGDGPENVRFCGALPEGRFGAVLSVRTLHENFEQSGVPELEPLEDAGCRLADRMASHAGLLTGRVAPDGALICLERCRADAVLLGWLTALGRRGFRLERWRRIDARECGRPAQFHGLVLRRCGGAPRENLRRFCDMALPEAPGDALEGVAAEAFLLRWAGPCRYGFTVLSPDGLRMGRGGVWEHGGDGGKLLLFQSSPAGRMLRVWTADRLPEAEAAVRRSAEQARQAGYRIVRTACGGPGPVL